MSSEDTINNDNNDNSKTLSKEERINRAELEMYSDILYSNMPGHFNVEDLGDCSKEAINYHKKAEPFDNSAWILDQIVDERIRKNHREWVDEVTPWAGTASIISKNDFNPGDYISFQGLRRPRGVPQSNPWQITEVTESDLEDNKPFII